MLRWSGQTPLGWMITGIVVLSGSLLVLLVLFFQVPWGGEFNRRDAGPVSGWVGNLLTGLGILGLVYELSQIRQTREDETVREMNSLFTDLHKEEWPRDSVPGTVHRISIQNFGDHKAMSVMVTMLLPDGDPVPDSWLVTRQENLVLPPRSVPTLAVQYHAPSHEVRALMDAQVELVVQASWIDAWGRSIEMTDNGPSMVRR